MSDKYSTLWYKAYHWVASLPSVIKWDGESKTRLTDEQREEIIKKLASGYYVILTGNKKHLSSVIVSFFTWVKTGKWSRYSHALMNCDFMDNPKDVDKFKFLEATAVGVHYSTFDEVFACDYVCLLSPKNIENEEWTVVIDELVENNGKPYDDLFDLADTTRLSCVELVLEAFKSHPTYKEDFAHLEELIRYRKNLLPQMYKDCTDFTVVYEI